MVKAAIFYSSQNGSTKKVAERIKTILYNKGSEVSLFNVNQKNNININIEEYNLIGIGCPVYISRPSYVILDFLDGLSSLASKKVFTFITYSTEIGDGANWLRHKIFKKGGIDIGCFRCTGKNLFPGYTKNGYIFTPNGPTNSELASLEVFVKELLFRFTNEIYNKSSICDQKPSFIYRFERFVTNRFLIKYFYSHFFAIDNNKCTQCDVCIKNCLMNNISKDKNDCRKFGRNCILCLKCEISCPSQAISSPISWIIFKPFLSINIKHAITRNIQYKKI